MTPRSPPKPKAASRFTSNLMDKWNAADESHPVQVLSATSFDPRHSAEDILNK